MSERPILFSGEMVRAILAGKKTQTRRVIKPQPQALNDRGWFEYRGKSRGKCTWNAFVTKAVLGTAPIEEWCPYGQPGDRLWVRETWNTVDYEVDYPGVCIRYKASEPTPGVLRQSEDYWISWDIVEKHGDNPDKYMDANFRSDWRPSIHMPRWASRITLEVTGVRVEQVQDISEADVQAEGCETGSEYWYDEFRKLWNAINDKRGFGWYTNPWVWVVEFRMVRP